MRETILRRLDDAERKSKGETSGVQFVFKLQGTLDAPFMAQARSRYPGRELLVVEVVESDLASDDIAARSLVDALVDHTRSEPKEDQPKPPAPASTEREYTALDRARAIAFIAAKARREAIH